MPCLLSKQISKCQHVLKAAWTALSCSTTHNQCRWPPDSGALLPTWTEGVALLLRLRSWMLPSFRISTVSSLTGLVGHQEAPIEATGVTLSVSFPLFPFCFFPPPLFFVFMLTQLPASWHLDDLHTCPQSSHLL